MQLDKQWRQIGGDMDPATYGCVLARTDGIAIDVLEIQPVLEYVSKSEARDLGFPFWSREATYWIADLRSEPRFTDAYRSSEVDPQTDSDVALVDALIRYGVDVEESVSGWARDVFPSRAHYWCRAGKRPVSGAYFASADAEFRREIRP